MRLQTILCAMLVLAVLQPFAHGEDNPADAVQGQWLTDNGDSRIEIIKVTKKTESDDGKTQTQTLYNGKIAWIKDPLYPEDDPDAGKPRRDRNNPDESKQDTPLLGLFMLKSFKYAGENKWTDGTIYDPTNGKVYKCQMTLVPGKAATDDTPAEPAKLNVRGYLGIPAFGRTTTWVRYMPPKEKKAEKASE